LLQIIFGCRRVFHDFANQNHEKHVGFKLKFGAKGQKRLFMALCSKLYLDGGLFFVILRSKITKNRPPSKKYFAAAGGA